MVCKFLFYLQYYIPDKEHKDLCMDKNVINNYIVNVLDNLKHLMDYMELLLMDLYLCQK